MDSSLPAFPALAASATAAALLARAALRRALVAVATHRLRVLRVDSSAVSDPGEHPLRAIDVTDLDRAGNHVAATTTARSRVTATGALPSGHERRFHPSRRPCQGLSRLPVGRFSVAFAIRTT